MKKENNGSYGGGAGGILGWSEGDVSKGGAIWNISARSVWQFAQLLSTRVSPPIPFSLTLLRFFFFPSRQTEDITFISCNSEAPEGKIDPRMEIGASAIFLRKIIFLHIM